MEKFTFVSRYSPRTKIRRHIDSKGYVMIKVPDYPYARKNGYIQEHRFVYEQWLGRQLNKDEIVHHKDGNKQNNSMDNLLLMLKKDHDTLNFEIKPFNKYKPPRYYTHDTI